MKLALTLSLIALVAVSALALWPESQTVIEQHVIDSKPCGAGKLSLCVQQAVISRDGVVSSRTIWIHDIPHAKQWDHGSAGAAP